MKRELKRKPRREKLPPFAIFYSPTNDSRDRAATVVRWLNGDSPTGPYRWPERGKHRWSKTSQQRVIHLIKVTRRVFTGILQASDYDLYWKMRLMRVDEQFKMTPLDRDVIELQTILMRYKSYPGFCHEGRECFFDTVIAGQCPSGEWVAARQTIDLTREGLLDRLRQCICDAWFFAKREDQKSCSAKCRHKIYERSPEAKQLRREYMKRYYKLKQSGKVK